MTSTTSCPHCGARLEANYAAIMGRRVFCGWRPCGCPGAAAERAERARLEARAKAEEVAVKRRRAYERAGIKPRFMAAASPMAGVIAAKVGQGRGAYICGPVGTGKTHLASAVARLLVDGGTSVKVTDMLGVLAAIKGTYGGDGTEDGVLSRLSRVGCLVLDDLGKESPTDWTLGQVFRVVNDRYESMRPVIVTTQYGKGDLIRRLAKNGDEETAVAIVSRLSEMCDKYELQGKDRRLSNGER